MKVTKKTSFLINLMFEHINDLVIMMDMVPR